MQSQTNFREEELPTTAKGSGKRSNTLAQDLNTHKSQTEYKAKSGLSDDGRQSSQKSKNTVKDNFKFSFQRSDIHVATGMSENLIYRPQNILLLQEQLNDTDTEISEADSLGSQTENRISLPHSEDYSPRNQGSKQSIAQSKPEEVDLFYSQDFDPKFAHDRGLGQSQVSFQQPMELSESFLDLTGTPFKDRKLAYTPAENLVAALSLGKDSKCSKESNDKQKIRNQTKTVLSEEKERGSIALDDRVGHTVGSQK